MKSYAAVAPFFCPVLIEAFWGTDIAELVCAVVVTAADVCNGNSISNISDKIPTNNLRLPVLHKNLFLILIPVPPFN